MSLQVFISGWAATADNLGSNELKNLEFDD